MGSLHVPPQVKSNKKSSPVRYLDTKSAYDLWSEVYDTDGNFLQALDTIEMKTLIPSFLSQLSTTHPWKLVDLGCGTGRNTIHLLHTTNASVVGLDASPKMLEVARSRVESELSSRHQSEVTSKIDLEVYDIMGSENVPEAATYADAVISTLVLEHVPVDKFFSAVSEILKPGGLLLLTNMHSEMGGISQAGFVDLKTGEKIRPTSYPHRIEDVVAGAEKLGFSVEGQILERAVDEHSSKALGSRATKWIGVKVWFCIHFRKDI